MGGSENELAVRSNVCIQVQKISFLYCLHRRLSILRQVAPSVSSLLLLYVFNLPKLGSNIYYSVAIL